MRLCSLTFFESIIYFSNVFLFSENNFPRCKLFRWSARILAVRKAFKQKPTNTFEPRLQYLRFTLCHLARSLCCLLAHHTHPGTSWVSLTFCFWGNIGLTTRRTALERSNFLPWEREFLYNPVPHLISRSLQPHNSTFRSFLSCVLRPS